MQLSGRIGPPRNSVEFIAAERWIRAANFPNVCKSFLSSYLIVLWEDFSFFRIQKDNERSVNLSRETRTRIERASFEEEEERGHDRVK